MEAAQPLSELQTSSPVATMQSQLSSQLGSSRRRRNCDPYSYEPSKPNPFHCSTMNANTQERILRNIDNLCAPTFLPSSSSSSSSSSSLEARSSIRIARDSFSGTTTTKRKMMSPKLKHALLKMKRKDNPTLQRLLAEQQQQQQQQVHQSQSKKSKTNEDEDTTSVAGGDSTSGESQEKNGRNNDSPGAVKLGRPQRRLSCTARTA